MLFQKQNRVFQHDTVFVPMLVPTWLHFGAKMGQKSEPKAIKKAKMGQKSQDEAKISQDATKMGQKCRLGCVLVRFSASKKRHPAAIPKTERDPARTWRHLGPPPVRLLPYLKGQALNRKARRRRCIIHVCFLLYLCVLKSKNVVYSP